MKTKDVKKMVNRVRKFQKSEKAKEEKDERNRKKEIRIIFSNDNNYDRLKCRWIIENFLEFLNKEEVEYKNKGGEIVIL